MSLVNRTVVKGKNLEYDLLRTMTGSGPVTVLLFCFVVYLTVVVLPSSFTTRGPFLDKYEPLSYFDRVRREGQIL